MSQMRGPRGQNRCFSSRERVNSMVCQKSDRRSKVSSSLAMVLYFILVGSLVFVVTFPARGGELFEPLLNNRQPDGSSATGSAAIAGSGDIVVPPDMIAKVAEPPRCWFLNMRQGPGIRFRIKKTLKAGTPLKILGRDPVSGWYKVNDGRSTGWCSHRYIAFGGYVPPIIGEKPDDGDSSDNDDGPITTDLGGNLNPADFGYDSKRYKPVFDLVQKFCDSNKQYKLAGGHTWQDGFASITDCSGFTGSFYQKLAALSGIPPVFPKGSWYPTSTNYKSSRYSEKITSEWPPPNPRNKIKPGDIFVMNKGAKYGHVGVFMGYDRSGNPVIAHSTTRRENSYMYGKQGTTGVRIEVLPRHYRQRWAGIYRIKGTDQMLDKLART